ncbi:hypothetical protein CHUAL_012554 [Chamberlinius hualienensis]
MAVENGLCVISVIPRFRRQNDCIFKHHLGFFTVLMVIVLCLLAPIIANRNVTCMRLEPSITDSNVIIGEFSLAEVPRETAFALANHTDESSGDGISINHFNKRFQLSTNISGPIRRDVQLSDVNEISYIKPLPLSHAEPFPLNNFQQNDFDNRQQRRKQKLKYASMNKNTTKKLNSSESTKPVSNQIEDKNRDPRGGEHVYNESPANLLFDVILRECQQTTVCLKCLKPLTTKRQFYSIATNFGNRYPTVAAMPLDKFDNGCQRSKVACRPTLCPVTICPVTICPATICPATICPATICPAAPVCETTTQLCQTTTVTPLCETTPPCPTTTRTCIKKICYFPTECVETTLYDCNIEPSWSFAVANYKVTPSQLSTNCDGEIITHPTRPTMKCFPAWWSCRTKCTKTTTCEYEMVTPRC